MTARYLPERDTARLRQAARLRVTTAEKAAELIDAHAKALSAADTAAAKARDARARLSKAQRVAAEREAAVENAIMVIAESLSSWARGLDEPIRPPAELLENWSGLVSGLVAARSPAPVLATAIGRAHLIPVRRPYDGRRAALDRDLTDNATARKALQARLGLIEAERDPSPRDPEFWLRRRRPEGVTTTGAPFWRLVETLDGAPAAELEAALDAAGLLQAWVTSDGAYLSGRDGSETVWSATTGTTHAESSLRTVMRPADDSGDLADVVERLLASVAYGQERLPEADAAVAADGHWRHGELTGRAAPAEDAPRLLGAAARSADRERRITQLRDQLTDLADEHELLSLELEEVTRLLGALDAASEQLPTDTEVVSAVLLARDAAQRVEDAAAEAEHAAEAERDARSGVDAAAADVADHCGEHSLPRTRTEVGAVIRAVSGYESLLSSLDAALSLINPLRDTAGQAAEALDGFRSTAATASRDAEHDRAEAVSLRAKSSAAKAALTQDAQEILLEVSQLRQRIKAAEGTLKRLAIEHEALTGKLSRAEAILEQAEAKRKDAEANRESAVHRWWGCVDTGLPGLRGVPEPPARHVTAALETARAARSAISIRDWPDDQNLTAQRVQNRWAAMVESASGLRSALEQLGGRSIRVIPPGDGREDFPGGVELMVDGTGAALAPAAAAERLSSLLIRLQEDYDEELTKTINELLGSTFIEHLRDRLAAAEALRADINAKLAQNPTAISGITLRLQRVPVSEERAANDVLDALERDFDLLPKPAQEHIRTFLADRITNAQEVARTSGDPRWRSRLAQILDYRRWFDLRLEYRTPRSQFAVGSGATGGWRTLDRGDHGLLSGGAKVVTLLQPFIAALHAMYDQAGSGPRMLWLDEAFGGVDGTNKASMFRLLASCDLDWMIAGPGIIANSATVPLAAIYEVRRAPQPLPGVSLELAVWTGNELTHVLTPDPADLRDLAATDDPADDTLFSDL
jgi:regulator of replication initiation timing